MRLLVLTFCVGCFLFGQHKAVAQLYTLIDPFAEGGFEAPGGLADNGWTAVNAGQVHGWAANTGVTDAAGSRAAFMTSDYQNANPAVAFNPAAGTVSMSHFYRDVTLPAGAGNLLLSFKYRSNYNNGTSINPPLRVFVSSFFTNNTYIAGALPIGVSTVVSSVPSSTANWQLVVVQLNPSLAGQTIRLAFTSSIPASVTTSSPFGMQVDSISLTARAGGGSVTNLNSNGLWTDPANWSGGYIPGPQDQVTIAQQSTVSATGGLTVYANQLSLLENATLNASVIQSEGSILVSNGAMLSVPTGTIIVRGSFTLLPGANANLQSTFLNFENLQGNVAQTFNFSSASQFTNSRVAAITVNNPLGVSIPGSPGPLTMYRQLSLVRGAFTHNNNIRLFHAAASAVAQPLILNVMGGSMSVFPPVDAANRLDLRYLKNNSVGFDTTYVMGDANELPPDRTISRLTVGSAYAVVQVNDSLFVTDSDLMTLLLLGIVKVASGKAIVLTNSSYPGIVNASAANQAHVQGTLVYTINGTNISERSFPVGSGGSRRIFSMRGITATNARVAVECVPPEGGTAGAGLSALGETHRWQARLISGTLSKVDSIEVQASMAEGFALSSAAQRRVARSETLGGTYTNVSNGVGSFLSPQGFVGEIVRSSVSNYNTLGFFASALASGNFIKTWTGFAGTNNWNDAANWTGGTLPTCNTDVSISKPYIPLYINSNSVCGNLLLSNYTIVQVQSGGRLTLGCNTGSGKQIQFNGSNNRFEVLTGGEVRVQ
ncbi:hypothetical protein [Phnomibacter sp. MR]|uniref:hypothetical protein n=1 Tax=Phnomibacter sp. MR TaxID=3042318 RepID=UPI003A807823